MRSTAGAKPRGRNAGCHPKNCKGESTTPTSLLDVAHPAPTQTLGRHRNQHFRSSWAFPARIQPGLFRFRTHIASNTGGNEQRGHSGAPPSKARHKPGRGGTPELARAPPSRATLPMGALRVRPIASSEPPSLTPRRKPAPRSHGAKAAAPPAPTTTSGPKQSHEQTSNLTGGPVLRCGCRARGGDGAGERVGVDQHWPLARLLSHDLMRGAPAMRETTFACRDGASRGQEHRRLPVDRVVQPGLSHVESGARCLPHSVCLARRRPNEGSGATPAARSGVDVR